MAVKSGKGLTKKVLLAASGSLLLYEAWALVNKKGEDTISETFWDYVDIPIFSFACGMLMGHFFWQRSK